MEHDPEHNTPDHHAFLKALQLDVTIRVGGILVPEQDR